LIPIMKPFIGREEADAAADAVSSGWVAQGPRVAELERRTAELVHAEHGVAVSSCTTGLELALSVLGIGRGDEVVVPSLSFIATANAVHHVGARPVFADVDLVTQNLVPATIEPVLTGATRAVILVHQGGTPADVAGVHELCDRRGIAVVEDAACAIGSRIAGRPIGGHSDLVVFSFHPRKVITTGEGGMVMARQAEHATRMRRLREHGMSMSAADRAAADDVVIERYLEIGFNHRMTDIQAAVGIVQLGRLDDIVDRRRALAARYQEQLAAVDGITFVVDPPDCRSNFQSFWVLLDDDVAIERNDVLRHLLADGISARRGIMASHLEPAYAEHQHVPLPVTERVTARSLLLPLFHELTEDEQDRVTSSLVTAIGRS
jgi:dTDP-4-amino-4,6-dideoxygalactose transaminase